MRNKNLKLIIGISVIILLTSLNASFSPTMKETDLNNINPDDEKIGETLEELQPSTVFDDNNDRTPVSDTTIYPYRTICKLYGTNSSGHYSIGTAFIIDKFHALTAAHCIYNDDKYLFDEYYIVPGDYYLNNFKEEPYGLAHVRNIRMEWQWIEFQWTQFDWAFLTLDRNIGSVTGWMGIQTASQYSDIYEETLYTAGYPSDLGNGQNMYEVSDQGSFATENLHYFEMDAYEGQSGSPVWRYDSVDDAEYILTVLTAGGPVRNHGTRIKDSRFDNILSWIEVDSISTPIDYPDMQIHHTPGTNVYSFGLSPFAVKPGVTTFTPWSIIHNKGTAPTGTFKVSYYASTDDLISTMDHLLGTDTVSSISPFETHNSSISITFPFISTGNYYIGCIIDSDNSVVEYNELNNRRSFSRVFVEPAIKVINPSEKNLWVAGTAQEITWISTGPIFNVEITLLKAGASPITIISSTANDGSFTWLIPKYLNIGIDYKILIRDTGDTAYDESDYFTILSQMPFINIRLPSMFTSWVAGTTHFIKWDPNPAIQVVSIALLYPGHSPVIIVPKMPNHGEYSWTISSNLATRDDYRIIMVDACDHSRYGLSTSFEITELPKTITIINPMRRAPWEKGRTHTITWSSTGPISNVKIYLYKEGLGHRTISLSTMNDGSFSWTVPRSLDPSHDYQIVIADENDNNVYDFSYEFRIIEDITPPGQPILNLPTNEDVLKSHTPYFDWIKPSGDPVTYQFQLDSSASYDIMPFVMPIIDTEITVSEITIPSGLYEGKFYWRVRARDEFYNWGPWSSDWSFIIDDTGPVAPALLTPFDGSLLNNYPVSIEWLTVSDAVSYRIQIDDSSNSFTSIIHETVTQNIGLTLNSLPDGTYFWRVKARDEVGNWGSWSTSWSFIISLDSDNDGISDVDEELIYGTDALNPDTDGDGLSDGEEVFNLESDPLNYMDPVHLPIFIDGDATGVGAHNWTWALKYKVCTGSGTLNDPYVIENFQILTSSSTGIQIIDSSEYFIIRNCYIEALDYGIYVENTADGTVKIINNTCRNVYNWFGISIWTSNYAEVINNTCINCIRGIMVAQSPYSTIFNNTCTGGSGIGIGISQSDYSKVANNTCINNFRGIYLYASNCLITNNTCSNNRREGIYMAEALTSFCTVSNNYLESNMLHGIYIEGGSDNVIEWNNFVENNQGGCQAYDDGSNNIFKFNYWSDWTSPDVHIPFGIVDMAYHIDGSAYSQDNYPRTIGFSLHSPIYIDNNEDFGPLGYDFLGTGTEGDPYIIDAYTFIDSSSTLIHIQDTDVYFIIRNCFLDGKTEGNYGIFMSNVQNGKIEGNRIRNLWIGIALISSCSDNEISQNSILVCKYACLTLDSSHYNTIADNSISNCDQFGVRFYNSNNNLILDNKIWANKGYGVFLYNSDYNIISNNRVMKNQYDGIALFSSQNNVLTNNELLVNRWRGIFLHESSFNIIKDCEIIGHTHSIEVQHLSSYNEITNNILAYNTETGISLSGTSYNIISNNTIYNNDVYGIYLYQSMYETISNNTINNNIFCGIQISDNSNYNNIALNNISHNINYGIRIYESGYNTIEKNIISNNNGYGFFAGDMSYDNVIEWNDFVENNQGYCQAYDGGINNIFEYNYWSDWTIPDSEDPIGIVDIPYSIDGIANNQDPYPRTGEINDPIQRSLILINDVIELVDDGILNTGQGTALTIKLELAILKINNGQFKIARNILQAFINQVYDLINTGVISQEEGEQLIAIATNLINKLSE